MTLPKFLWLRRLLGRPASLGWFFHPATEQYDPPHHPESPQRIIAIQDELIRQKIWPRLTPIRGREATDLEIALAHSRSYLFRLEAHRPKPGKIHRLDDDTVLTHNALTAARFATGSVLKAVDYVMAGKIKNAFCAIRPPGHHARSRKNGSFCLLNHAAAAALYAATRHRLKRIAILDFDIHRGDGTEEILGGHPYINILGISQNRLYPFDDALPPENCRNVPLPENCTSRTFREKIRQEWLPRLKEHRPQLILLSAGFDGHQDDPLSNTRLHTADYAWLTHKIMRHAPNGSRIVSILEGGYHLESLAQSAAAHLHVLAGLGKPEYAAEYEKTI
ncbi:MAG: histone deacetylase family protein [Neisseria sp.]|nr:histone deacetylase family protein [Neisseria sp.]